MRAVVCTAYGPPDVLQLRDVAKPVPKDDEVLIRIRATTASTADCELRRFDFAPWIWLPMRLGFGFIRPRQPVLGQELAGDVESAGKDVVSLKAGDRVFATTGIGLGAYAEYVCLRENPQTGAIATMPANLSYEEAAAVPYGGGEALGFLRKADVRSGQRVLVNGAGGSFGTFAVQLAKVLGAHVHRGGQRGETGDAGLDRCGSRHRLLAGGLHRRSRGLRRDLRHRPRHTVRSHGGVTDRERVPAPGQSGLLADRSRQVGVEGDRQAGVVRGIGRSEREPGPPAKPGRSGEAAPGHRSVLSRSSRWSRLTDTRRPARSWGTSSSPSRSRGRRSRHASGRVGQRRREPP